MSSCNGVFKRGRDIRSAAATGGVVDLARQVAHLLREAGESRPLPLIGGYVVEARPDGGVNVSWRAVGPLAPAALRMRSLRRYQRILGGLRMITVLQTNVREPYLACWMPRARARIVVNVRVVPALAGDRRPGRQRRAASA